MCWVSTSVKEEEVESSMDGGWGARLDGPDGMLVLGILLLKVLVHIWWRGIRDLY